LPEDDQRLVQICKKRKFRPVTCHEDTDEE